MANSHKPKHLCDHPSDFTTSLHTRNPIDCGSCETPIVGEMYNCRLCDSHLHFVCYNGNETLTSEFHPGHTLTRLKAEPLGRCCTVCSEEITGLAYTCRDGCFFHVHTQCLQLPPSVPHELVVRNKPTEPDLHKFALLQLDGEKIGVTNSQLCHVCGHQCGNCSTYRCDACSINVHYQCLLRRNNEPNGPTTIVGRGVDRHFNSPCHGQSQPRYGVPMPYHPPPPPLPYYYANGYHLYGNEWYLNYLYSHGGGWGGYNNNHGAGGSVAGGTGIMGKIGTNLAVGLVCDLILNMAGT